MFFVLIVVVGASLLPGAFSNHKLDSAAYFKQHSNVLSYEISAKVVFKVVLPMFNSSNPGKCEGTDLQCIAESMIYNRREELKSMLWKHPSAAKTKRVKRQAGLVVAGFLGGLALHSIFTLLGSKMSGSDSDAEGNINRLWSSMHGYQKQFLLFREDVNLYSQNLSRALNRSWWFDSVLEKQTRSHLHLTQVNQFMDRVNFGMQRCGSHFVPFQFISSFEFHSKLLTVQNQTKAHGYKLAIDPENLHEYLQLPLADCFLTDSNVYVLVNIPMYKKRWTIYDMIPIPFAYQNQTCALETRHTDLVAVSIDEVKILDLNSRPFCDLVQKKLCLVPMFQYPTEQSSTCASNIFHKTSVESIGNACLFKCTSKYNVIVTPLEKNKVAVTNGKVLIVKCKESSNRFPLYSFGALEILLKCNCSYKVDSKNISTDGACIDSAFNDIDVKNIAPHFLLTPSLPGAGFDLYHNWSLYLPTLNYTNTGANNNEPLSYEPFPMMGYSLNARHLSLWLVVLSVLVTVLSIIIIFYGCLMKINFK